MRRMHKEELRDAAEQGMKQFDGRADVGAVLEQDKCIVSIRDHPGEDLSSHKSRSKTGRPDREGMRISDWTSWTVLGIEMLAMTSGRSAARRSRIYPPMIDRGDEVYGRDDGINSSRRRDRGMGYREISSTSTKLSRRFDTSGGNLYRCLLRPRTRYPFSKQARAYGKPQSPVILATTTSIPIVKPGTWAGVKNTTDDRFGVLPLCL